MSANASETNVNANTPQSVVASAAKTEASGPQESASNVPQKITNAQTVCNQRNEKGKLCNGHLKQLRTGGEAAEEHLRGNDVLFKCQVCGTLYMGPPLGHVRDPDKQQRFVERELAALLQAAGGTLPAITKNEKGVHVLAEPQAEHAPAKAAAPAAAPKRAAAQPAATPAPAGETPEEKKARLLAEAQARKATGEKAAAPVAAKPPAKSAPKTSLGPIPGASGPVPGETHEQKIARLRAVVAEAKRRQEAAGEGEPAAAQPAGHTTPTAASTSGMDSSAQADAHRPAAEAQASTGMASAVPLSPAAATASPAAGAETAADLAPDSVPKKSPAVPPKSAAPRNPIPGASGPVPGETHEQKIARLKAVIAAAKERAEREGGASH